MKNKAQPQDPGQGGDPALAIEALRESFAAVGYICDSAVATTVYLGQHLKKPILVEGPPGVGKTELARACAEVFDLPLIRLQCYEGLDESKALYEWKYGKQLLYIQMLRESLHEVLPISQGMQASFDKLREFNDLFFSEEFLEPRPLLRALRQDCALLLDEVDKADPEFEALLLEILSDAQVSVPEIGTVKAEAGLPLTILTSNNTREISDALKRRCLHLHIPFPSMAHEERILRIRAPQIKDQLRRQLLHFVHGVRDLDLGKPPCVSETIDWARTLTLLNVETLEPNLVRETLNVLLKRQEDVEAVLHETPRLLRAALSSG